MCARKNIVSETKESIERQIYIVKQLGKFPGEVQPFPPCIYRKVDKKDPQITQYDLFFVPATKTGLNTRQIAGLFNIPDASVQGSYCPSKINLD